MNASGYPRPLGLLALTFGGSHRIRQLLGQPIQLILGTVTGFETPDGLARTPVMDNQVQERGVHVGDASINTKKKPGLRPGLARIGRIDYLCLEVKTASGSKSSDYSYGRIFTPLMTFAFSVGAGAELFRKHRRSASLSDHALHVGTLPHWAKHKLGSDRGKTELLTSLPRRSIPNSIGPISAE